MKSILRLAPQWPSCRMEDGLWSSWGSFGILKTDASHFKGCIFAFKMGSTMIASHLVSS